MYILSHFFNYFWEYIPKSRLSESDGMHIVNTFHM